jgi:Tfp pilus assembly protein PilO
MTEIQITEADLQASLQQKVNQVTNLELHVNALGRTVAEQNERIEELEAQLANDKESSDAKGGKKAVSV